MIGSWNQLKTIRYVEINWRPIISAFHFYNDIIFTNNSSFIDSIERQFHRIVPKQMKGRRLHIRAATFVDR